MGFVSLAGRIEANSSSAAQLYKICKEMLTERKELIDRNQALDEECKNLTDVVVMGALTNKTLSARVSELEYLDRRDDQDMQCMRDELLDAGVL